MTTQTATYTAILRNALYKTIRVMAETVQGIHEAIGRIKTYTDYIYLVSVINPNGYPIY